MDMDKHFLQASIVILTYFKNFTLLDRAYSKEIARSLIREEGLRLDALIKESYSKRKSIKELFLKKGDSNQNSYAGNKFLKDPLV